MVQSVTTTFAIPYWISQGLAKGTYERVGGVVRETGNKQVVAWLREAEPATSLLSNITTITGFATLGVSVLSLGVSIMGFLLMSKKFKELEKALKEVQVALEKINYKIDLSFYTNFLAAIDLARNAFTMENS